MTESEQLLGMISEMRTLAASVRTRKVERAITLEDVGKSKVIFDTYIVLKAVTFVREEMKKSGPARAAIRADQGDLCGFRGEAKSLQ